MQPDHVPLRKHCFKKIVNSLHKEQVNSQDQHSVHFIGQSNIACINSEQPASPSQNCLLQSRFSNELNMVWPCKHR